MLGNLLEKYKNNKKRYRRSLVALCVLSCLVALTVFKQLMQPALTMNTDSKCGYQEHVHDNSCDTPCLLEEHVHSDHCYLFAGMVNGEPLPFESEENLSDEPLCGMEEHNHLETCYEEFVLCELPEDTQGHIHNEECEEEELKLICSLDENQEHIHEENCYEEVIHRVCGKLQEHQHTEECYIDLENMICQQEETENHTHEKECYAREETPICGLEEYEPHVHTEECLEYKLVCAQSAHAHSAICFVQSDVLVSADEKKEADTKDGEHFNENELERIEENGNENPVSSSDTRSDRRGEIAAYGPLAITNTVSTIKKNNIVTGFTNKYAYTTENNTTYINKMQYSDDGGITWTDTDLKENNKVFTLTTLLTDAADVCERLFRTVVTATPKGGSPEESGSESFRLIDTLEADYPGFIFWLENTYVEELEHDAPVSVADLYSAYALYGNLAKIKLKPSFQKNDSTVKITATVSIANKYTYIWQYSDSEGNWKEFERLATTVNGTTSSVSRTQDEVETFFETMESTVVRCVLELNGAIYNVSEYQPFSAAIVDAAIMEALYGFSVELFETYYYNNVIRDPRIPFYDGQSFLEYLNQIRLESGEEEMLETYNKHIYDLKDPNWKISDEHVVAGGYGDDALVWPKDDTSPFHGNISGGVGPLDYNYLEDGVNYAMFFDNLNKSATAVQPGDANTERDYKIAISADGAAATLTPMVMVLQIQTSWQMFDLQHANAQIGDGTTKVGGASYNTALANLYDIKQALLRFSDYVKEYNDTSVAIGVTNVQHGGSNNMIVNGSSKLTNNMDDFKLALYGWDSFGDCEHIHYDTKALEGALNALSTDLSGWKDEDGNVLDLDQVKKVSVIIGGPTENTNGKDGYGCILPWNTLHSKVNSVYGIRVNEGYSVASGFSGVSWLDHPDNNVQTTTNHFDKKYIATTEDMVFNSLVDLFEREQNRLTNHDTKVEDTIITDVVRDEFVVKPETVKVFVDNEEVPIDPTKLSIIENQDRTTTVSYNFGSVYNGTSVRLEFEVRARENYIGSNNVFTNVDVPSIEYTHPRDPERSYSKNYTDQPKVNVPIRFGATDGEAETIYVGESVDLKDLSGAIVKDIEERISAYDQIDGTVTYEWLDENGNVVMTCEVTVENGKITVGELERSHEYVGKEEGSTLFDLNMTFTPNDPQADSGEGVSSLTDSGRVWITVLKDKRALRVAKIWADGPGNHEDDFVNVILYADGEEIERITLNAENNWEMIIEDVPIENEAGDEIVYTIIEEEKENYEASYDTNNEVQNVVTELDTVTFYATLLFIEKVDKKTLQIKVIGDDGTTHTYSAPDKVTINKNGMYSFEMKGLPKTNTEGRDINYQINQVIVDGKNWSDYRVDSYESKTECIETLEGYLLLSVTNTPDNVKLPNTGGGGLSRSLIIGTVLMAIACIFLYKRKNKFTES